MGAYTVKIIQADIWDYKRMMRRQWHDQKWHDFMRTDKSMAIGWAIDESRPGDHVRDITENAKKFYRAIQGGNNG
jgi:hypothetical protein